MKNEISCFSCLFKLIYGEIMALISSSIACAWEAAAGNREMLRGDTEGNPK